MTPLAGQSAARYVAVGVDVAEEGKGLDLVALDQDRRLVASRGRLAVQDVVELVLDQIRPSIVCIDSPSGWSRSGQSRDAERQLARVGIAAFATGTDPGEHRFYRWMRVGFSIFEGLAPDYPLFGAGEPRGTAAEVFPHASAVLLAGGHRSGAETKVVFRRRVLRTFGVDEWALPNLDRVDAAVGALTGLLALEGCWTAVGEPTEGAILVPVVALPTTRLPGTQSGGDPSPYRGCIDL